VEPINNVAVVAERQMSWQRDQQYGASAATAVRVPSMRWYFAEGATHTGFDLFVLLANPHDLDAQVRLTFLGEDGRNIDRIYNVRARSRLTVSVDAVSGLSAAGVSTVVESLNGLAVYAERAMYWSNGGTLWRGGHASEGAAMPASRWFLAEGATGPYFDTFVLLANPSVSATTVRATFLRSDGGGVVREVVLPPTSRTTLWLDEIVGLENTAVSTVLDSLDGGRFVAERSMYWGGQAPAWIEGHSSLGVTEAGPRWALAGGQTDFDGSETYILLANPGASSTRVRVTILREDGHPRLSEEVVLPAGSRRNVHLAGVDSDFPSIAWERFGALVESLDGTGIVVEAACYWSVNGVVWEAGTNVTAQRLR
jgi:hypothetical protein